MKQINEFLLDPNVQCSMDWGRDQNVFSILNIDEIRHSRMLAWFLNTREGHLQGDFFLKELLRTYVRKKETISDLNGWPVDTYNFSNAIIITEYLVPETNFRIDIAIFDPDSEIAIFIENKAGSKERPNQTKDYCKNLKKKHERKYTCLFIFMDLNENSADDKKNWVSIDYEWLTLSIKSLLNREILPRSIEYILKDYKNYIENFEEETNPYFKNTYEKMAEVAHKHKTFLDNVKKLKSKNIPDLLECYGSSQGEDFLKYLYLRNQTYFDALFNIAEWEIFGNEITSRLKTNDSKIVLDFDYYKPHFNLSNEKWYELDAGNAEDDDCFMYIDVKKIKEIDKTDTEAKFQVKLILRNEYLNKKLTDYPQKKIHLSNSYKSENLNADEIVRSVLDCYKIADELYNNLKRELK